MPDNVFDQNTQTTNDTTTQTTPPDTTNLFADKLKEIVNDQGQPKYKDVNAALDALKAAQDHIKQLETEARSREAETTTLREAATKATALEEIVNRLTNNSQTKPNVETTTNAGMSEEQIVATLEKLLSTKDAQRVAQSNLDNVQNALVTKFGDKTKEVVAQKAKELGTTPSELGALSSKNPQLVLTLFGLVAGNNNSNPTVSSTNTPVNPPPQNDELKRPEVSILSGAGATDKNRKALMAQIKADVYKKLQVET